MKVNLKIIKGNNKQTDLNINKKNWSDKKICLILKY